MSETLTIPMPIDAQIDILKAIKAGETVQYKALSMPAWLDCSAALSPGLAFDVYAYRRKPQPKTVYVNIDADGFAIGKVTRGSADADAHYDRVACVKVTYTEGQYDA